MEYTRKLAFECADAGARLLDYVDPGWASYVNVADVRMRYTTTCVFGQLYVKGTDNDYTETMIANFSRANWRAAVARLSAERPELYEALWLESEQPSVFFGFDILFSDWEEPGPRTRRYHWLTDAWIAEITKRRRAWKTTETSS